MTYNRVADSWFVHSGWKEGRIFYEKTIFACESRIVNSVWIENPSDLKDEVRPDRQAYQRIAQSREGGRVRLVFPDPVVPEGHEGAVRRDIRRSGLAFLVTRYTGRFPGTVLGDNRPGPPAAGSIDALRASDGQRDAGR